MHHDPGMECRAGSWFSSSTICCSYPSSRTVQHVMVLRVIHNPTDVLATIVVLLIHHAGGLQ